jgi:hypothetical protein
LGEGPSTFANIEKLKENKYLPVFAEVTFGGDQQ